MKQLWLLTKKNLKLLLRSRTSALIIIFAPLLIILILGLSFNTSDKFGLRLGMYAPSFSEDVNSFISLLEQEQFTVIKYESVNVCIEDIKSGNVHTCLSLPESLRVEDNTPKEVTFHIDPSKINLVWVVQETVKSKFNLKAQEISQELTGNILSKLASTKTTVGEKKDSLASIIEKTSSTSGTAASTKNSLLSLDVSISSTIYNSSALTDLSSDIDDSSDRIDEAISAVNSADATDGQKEEIRTLLNEAKAELTNALILTNSNSSGSVAGLISSLQTELQGVNTRLLAVSEAIGSANANLDTLSASVTETKTALEGLQSSLTAIHDDLASIKVTEAGTIAAPLISKIERVSEEGTYLNYLFPALLILIVMFSSLLLGTTLVMIEKNSPAYLRNFFLPVRKITFITSIYLTTMIISIVEIGIILLISLFFLKGSLVTLLLVALILLLAGSVFTLLGMAIGYIFTSEETGVLASISLGSVLLFLSGVIFPLEGISATLRKITSFSPFVLGEKVVRELFIFNSPLQKVAVESGILLAYAIGLFIVIIIIENVLHEHIVHRFLKHHHHFHRQNEKKNKNEA